MSVGVLENLFVPFHLGPRILALVVQSYTFLHHQLPYTERFCDDNFHTFFPSNFHKWRLIWDQSSLSQPKESYPQLSKHHINFGRDVSHWVRTRMPALSSCTYSLNFSVLANLEVFTRLKKKKKKDNRRDVTKFSLRRNWQF